MQPNPRAFTKWHWLTLGIITLIWWLLAAFYAAIFTDKFPQYQPIGQLTALGCAVVIGLLHLAWLGIFRGLHALYGLIIAKVVLVPVTLGFNFFALAMGAMGTDSGMEAAASSIHMLVPFMLIIAALPSTLGALVGAFAGWLVGKSKARAKLATEMAAEVVT